MPRLDGNKEKLNKLRRWQNYCVTAFVAVVAFVATKYDNISATLMWLCSGVVALSAMAIIILAIRINKIIDEIGRL